MAAARQIRRRLVAYAAGWRPSTTLVRLLRRHDGRELELRLVEHDDRCWRLTATENGHVAAIDVPADLDGAVVEAERFARRWLAALPGTSIATYVGRPGAHAPS